MSENEIVGRAGFHATHSKLVSERYAILHEAMRDLDQDAIAYWAEENPSIVVADEHLSESMVNDGNGGFRPATSIDEVIDYGDERVARLKGGIKKDSPRFNKKEKRYEMKGGTVTTSMIVSHLPKSLCVEIPDYYPVLHTKGPKKGEPMLDATTGEPLMRSRWVARDRDEARRYFEAVLAYMFIVAIPGGQSGVLGYSIQHSETTPHIQIIADPFGEHPDDPGMLRADWSRSWSRHRDVANANGHDVLGKTKMRGYHAGLKEHLIGLGYDISPDFDEEHHMKGLSKADYQQNEAHKQEAESLLQAVEVARQQNEREAERLKRVRRMHREQELQDEADAASRERVHTFEVENTYSVLDEYAGSIETDAEKAREAGYKAGRADWEADGRPRYQAALNRRLGDLRAEDRAEVNEVLKSRNAERDAFRAGLEGLKKLDNVETFGGSTVKQRRLKIAEGVENKIIAAESAPEIDPSSSRVQGGPTIESRF